MEKETIPSLTDEAWAKDNELGSVEEILEYTTAKGIKRVKAIAYIIGGSEMEAFTESHRITGKDGKPTLDEKTFNRDFLKLVFRIDGAQFQRIFDNKSDQLRTKMIMFANKVCGTSLTEKDVEKEKNSEGLDQSPGSSQ